MDDAAPVLSVGVTAGVIALVVALAAASGLGVVMRRRASGIMKPAAPRPEVLTEDDLGGPLGRQATLVQFSTAFCAPCRATKARLEQLRATRPGLAVLHVDAESHLDEVRELDVRRTPTLFYLGRDGNLIGRSSGAPRPDELTALVNAHAGTPA